MSTGHDMNKGLQSDRVMKVIRRNSKFDGNAGRAE